jgi:integrase
MAMRYKLTVSLLNRWRAVGKKADGHRLSWRRNANGTLTAWQRITVGGNDREVRVDTVTGPIDKPNLERIRAKGYALKNGESLAVDDDGLTLAEAWAQFYQAISATRNSRWNEDTAKKAAAKIRNHVEPTVLWGMKAAAITPSDIYEALTPLRHEKRPTEEKVRHVLSKVFAHLLGQKKVASNPCRSVPDIAANLERRPAVKHFPALTTFDDLGELLRANERSDAVYLLRAATEFQALTAQRTTNLVAARWEQIDLDAAIWTIPRATMKITGLPYDHQVPLSAAALALLERIKPREQGYVFPSTRATDGHLTGNALPKHLQRLGYQGRHVPHGWRSAFRSLAADQIIDGRPRFNTQWLESVLDHRMGSSPTEAAYIRSQCAAGARLALEWWSNALMAAKCED